MALGMATCGACGETLPPLRYRGNPRKWCSESCRLWAIRHPGEVRRRDCQVCGDALPKHHELYCSSRCKAAGDRNGWGRRRVLARGGDVGDPVYDVLIFERDGWKCHICGEDVSRDAKYPDPRSPSLDHVVAVSQGGAHDPSNAALAHLECNVAAGRALVAAV